MSEPVGRPGDWAELRLVLLAPGERAPGLPDDTARVPLEARVKGFLETEAAAGRAGSGRRPSLGRRVEGTLVRRPP